MGWGWRNRTRPDTGAEKVVLDLRAAGASVEIIGHPLDLLVGWCGVTLLVEIKRPASRGASRGGKLKPTQERFIARWRGSKPVVVTCDDAVAVVSREVSRLVPSSERLSSDLAPPPDSAA